MSGGECALNIITARASAGNPPHEERDSGAMTPLSYTAFSAVR
jgi:hypothetical protein